ISYEGIYRKGHFMNLNEPTEENLTFILEELSKKLKVANKSLLDPEDYDLDKYSDLKMMYDVLHNKETLSPSETDAFVKELSATRKYSSLTCKSCISILNAAFAILFILVSDSFQKHQMRFWLLVVPPLFSFDQT